MNRRKQLTILTITAITAFLLVGLVGTTSAQSFDEMPGPHSDCGTCHESSEPTAPVNINYSSEMCGQCHDEAMAGWEDSGHTGWGHYAEGDTLDDLASYETSCSCHFTEGAVWDLKTIPEDPEPADVLDSNNYDPWVQPETAQKNYINPGVDCVACHDPHTGETRVNDSELCGSCHNAQGTSFEFDVTTGFETHHPNHGSWEQWTGESFDWAPETEWRTSHHGTTAECTDCHPDHTFQFDPSYVAEENCNFCHHGDQTGADLAEEVNASMESFQEKFDEVEAELEEVADEMGITIEGGATDHARDFTATYQEEYDKLAEAKFYLDMITGDGSFEAGAMAIHNDEYASQLLTRAQTLIEQVEAPADTAPEIDLEVVTQQNDRRVGKDITIKATFNGEPIEGVTISTAEESVTTDERGEATLMFSEAGEYEVTAEEERFSTATTTLIVSETFEEEVDTKLGDVQETNDEILTNTENIETTVNGIMEDLVSVSENVDSLSDQISSLDSSLSEVSDTVTSIDDTVSGLSEDIGTQVDEAISGVESTATNTMYLAALAFIVALVAVVAIFMRT